MRNKEELLPTFLYYLQKKMINGGENCIVRKSHFKEVIYSFPKGCINAFRVEIVICTLNLRYQACRR